MKMNLKWSPIMALKKHFEKRKAKLEAEQHLRGYEYACGCLINKSATVEQLQSEVDTSKIFCTMDDFDYGILEAIELFLLYKKSLDILENIITPI